MKQDIKKIATHSGKFHADDLFGVATMKLLYPDADILRSRNPEKLATADVRIDVGGSYDPESGDFDHHQADFLFERENKIPYAAFGLIWKTYGETLIRKLAKADNHPDIDSSAEIAEKIDEKLVQPIDAIDNGINMCEAEHNIFPFNISHAVAYMNPTWDGTASHDDHFMMALDFAEKLLLNIIKNNLGSAKAAKLIEIAAEESGDNDYVILESYIPTGWLIDNTEKKFVVYPNMENDWTIKTIPVEKGSFEPRKMLPESWAGLTSEELAKVTGVEDAVFCHKGRWICAAKSKEGALKLLEIAINE